MSTGRHGMDVVLRMSLLDRPDQLARMMRHEFGHVVTLDGTDRAGDLFYSIDEWLERGVADYIASTPRSTLNTARIAPLRRAGNIPDDIRIPPLGDTASRAQVDHLYGYLAVRCLATRYGERR